MIKYLSAMGIVVVLASVFASSDALAQAGSANEEVTKQTTRQISDAIARRISQSALTAPEERKKGFNTWYTLSYNQITEDTGADFEIDIYQNLLGADWEFDKVYLGMSVAQAHTDIKVAAGGFGGGAFKLDTNSYTVSPYAALLIGQNFFVDVLGGYTWTDPGSEGDDAHTGFYEVGLNGVYAREKFDVVAKTGYRYNITGLEDDGNHDLFESYTYFAGLDLTLNFGRVHPYAKGWYERFIPETGEDAQSGFVGGGIKFAITDDVYLGMGAWTEVGNGDTNNRQGSLEIKAKF